MRVLLLLVLLCLRAGSVGAQSADAPAGAASPMAGDRLLLVAPAAADPFARRLADLLADRLRVDVSLVDPTDYAWLIDEQAYDGFVYLGSDYLSPPPQTFLADMAGTTKPLLWIGYHAWLLDEAFLAGKGLRIKDEHGETFAVLEYGGVRALPPTEASWVEAPVDSTLYWIFDADRRLAVPGAVVAGNFTYLSYLPSLDEAAPGFDAFLAALDAALGTAPPPHVPRSTFDDRVRQARSDDFRAGVHLPIYVSATSDEGIGYDSDQLHLNLLRIKAAGAEWVTLSQIYYQDGVRAAAIEADPALTPTFEALRGIVSDAHKAGLLVRLSPIVNLTEEHRRRDEWRGMIRPADGDAWWRSYTEMILEAAAFARDNEIESLNVGAELSAMQQDEKRWRALIAAVRDEVGYRGLVGYQVNYDALEPLAWSDALDYVAIAAYWPLAEDRDPALATLTAAWQDIGGALDRWRRDHEDAVIEFGEIGYASQPYASVYPFSWKPHKGQGRNVEEQLTCYLALEDFLAAHPEVNGVSIFASTDEDTDPQSIGYTPFGKPAEQVMSRILQLR